MSGIPPILKRLAVAAALGVAFVIMASVFAPDRTHAGDASRPAEGENATAGTATDPHAGFPSFGTLVSGRYRVEIYGTPSGARYSVYERTTRDELGVLLSAEQVAERFEDLPLPGTDFSAPDQFTFTDPNGVP